MIQRGSGVVAAACVVADTLIDSMIFRGKGQRRRFKNESGIKGVFTRNKTNPAELFLPSGE